MKISDELLDYYASMYIGQRNDITFEQYVILKETITALTIASARSLTDKREGVVLV